MAIRTRSNKLHGFTSVKYKRQRTRTARPKTPPIPPWPNGGDGDLIQSGGTLILTPGTSYNYGVITLDSVAISYDTPNGMPIVLGAAGDVSITNCVVTLNANSDVDNLYDVDGNPITYVYTITSPSGKVYNFPITGGSAGYGGSDGAQGNPGGLGKWGSGGGGGGDGDVGSDGTDTGGGQGGPGGTFNAPGGDGGRGLPGGQNIAFEILGNVVAFSGNTFDQSGSDAETGGTGATGTSSVGGGGGGGGSGGSAGSCIVNLHGTGKVLINDPTQFIQTGGAAGAGGAGGGSAPVNGTPGTDGSTGADGFLQVNNY